MEDICGGSKPYLSSAHLESEHLRIRDKAVGTFIQKRKMGGTAFSENYRIKLESDLDEAFEQFKGHNDSKNIFKVSSNLYF